MSLTIRKVVTLMTINFSIMLMKVVQHIVDIESAFAYQFSLALTDPRTYSPATPVCVATLSAQTLQDLCVMSL